MYKDNIVAILKSCKMLSKLDFEELAEDEKEENKEYVRGYLDAIDMVINQFEKNL